MVAPYDSAIKTYLIKAKDLFDHKKHQSDVCLYRKRNLRSKTIIDFILEEQI